MLLYQFLAALSPEVTPANSKIHLASWNGFEEPLDVYRRGLAQWEDWQAWQSKRNFERSYVVSLIQFPENGALWLFAGAYANRGKGQQLGKDGQQWWKYHLERLPVYDDALGRLVVHFRRGTSDGRASYRHADSEGFTDRLLVHELRARALGLPDFPGFKQLLLDFATLQAIVQHQEASWRTALSAVSGIYLISDRSDGKLYVGSAGGEGGIWGRWCQYLDGHGGNVELKRLVKEHGPERVNAFQFSILETADTSTSYEQLLQRESHWKQVLLSRLHGHNGN